MVDWLSVAISVAIAGPAYTFAALTYLESRRQRELLETLTRAIPMLGTRRARRRSTRAKAPSRPAVVPPGTLVFPVAPVVPKPDARLALQQKAEERRLLKLQLEREKEHWRRQKDVAKAIGWIIRNLGSSDEDEEDEDDDG